MIIYNGGDIIKYIQEYKNPESLITIMNLSKDLSVDKELFHEL